MKSDDEINFEKNVNIMTLLKEQTKKWKVGRIYNRVEVKGFTYSTSVKVEGKGDYL